MGKISNILQRVTPIPQRIGVLILHAVLTLWSIAAISSPVVEHLSIAITAVPESERMLVKTQLHLSAVQPGTYWAVFTEPKRLISFTDAGTSEAISHRFHPVPKVPVSFGYKLLEFTIESEDEKQTLSLEYEYDRASLAGYAPHPTTDDNLHLAQITKESIYSSHLYYYPEVFGGPQSAEIKIEVPQGWMAVSSGKLVSTAQRKDQQVFTYRADHRSGRLPYSLAIYPYRVMSFEYDQRVPISVYHAKEDAGYAQQKVSLIQQKILPFLENLMGPFPFESVKIVEVFPWEGNTGLAARGIVMLSQKIWFAKDIDDKLSSEAAMVLVDELAHQWNFYHVQLPNALAEGVSQYTDALFTEHIRGDQAFIDELEGYKASYQKIADLLNKLKSLYARGLSMEGAAAELGLSVDEIKDYWPYAEHGELPITDERVFKELYFLKGALALHALRLELGDASFFKAFKAVFQEPRQTDEMTLAEFQAVFETEHGQDLSEYFHRWYYEIGLP